MVHFEKQPPDNMRKSNFFHFIISLFDQSHQAVEVLRASFKDFCDTADVSGSSTLTHTPLNIDFELIPVSRQVVAKNAANF